MCSVFQRVAVCCSVLHYVAVYCSVRHCAAVYGSVRQCVAMCCSVRQFKYDTSSKIPLTRKHEFSQVNMVTGSTGNAGNKE